MHPDRLKFKEKPTPYKEIELSVPQSHNVRSGIFPIIREILDQKQTSVLDLGPPTSKKYRYFCRSGARVYWDNTPGSISNAFHGQGVARIGASKTGRPSWPHSGMGVFRLSGTRRVKDLVQQTE